MDCAVLELMGRIVHFLVKRVNNTALCKAIPPALRSLQRVACNALGYRVPTIVAHSCSTRSEEREKYSFNTSLSQRSGAGARDDETGFMYKLAHTRIHLIHKSEAWCLRASFHPPMWCLSQSEQIITFARHVQQAGKAPGDRGLMKVGL